MMTLVGRITSCYSGNECASILPYDDPISFGSTQISLSGCQLWSRGPEEGRGHSGAMGSQKQINHSHVKIWRDSTNHLLR